MSKKLDTKVVKTRLKRKKLRLVGRYVSVEKSIQFQCLICFKYFKTTLDTLMKKDRGVGCESCRRKASGFLSNNVVVDEMLGKGLKPLEAYKGYKTP